MKLLIATTREDHSRGLLQEAAREGGIDATTLYYEDIDPGSLTSEDFSCFGSAILRDPFNTGVSYLGTLERMLSFLPQEAVLDYGIMKDYLRYEDKLSQHMIFRDIASMPGFRHFSSPEEARVDSFPVILKKRISSRGKGIYIIRSREELSRFMGEHDIDGFLVEDFMDVEKDVRILVIGHSVAGAVQRKVRVKDNKGYRGIGVKVTGGFEVPEGMRTRAEEISEKIGSGFCGLDFAIDTQGKEWLIECNISPQFASFEKVMKSDIAGRLVRHILSRRQ